jgi:endonuclease YncB( thermonuclease family)
MLRKNFFSFLLCAAGGVCACDLHAQEAAISGAVHVIDGDTIDVGSTRIRIHGIDALEHGQSCTTNTGQNWGCGDWTTRQVRDRFQGVQATCDHLGYDRYNRVIGRCFVAGADIGATLVREGLAYAYRKYSLDYDLLEKQAYVADLGIHGFSAQSPARYRQTGGRPEQRFEDGCNIKGNIARKGEKIYHMPGQAFYDRTWISYDKGERNFCTEAQARASGWRKAKR